MSKYLKLPVAILVVFILVGMSSAGVHSDDSAPFVLNTFDFTSSAVTSSPFLLNTTDIATNSIGQSVSGSFLLNTGGEIPNWGTVSGYVTNAITSNPVPNAVISLTGGYSDNSDGTGYYEISHVPPGIGYIAVCSAGGLQMEEATGIEVTRGNNTTVNFALQPLLVDVMLDNLTPDPNPPVSEIMAGGTLHRHYLIRETNPPHAPVANVPVKLKPAPISTAIRKE